MKLSEIIGNDNTVYESILTESSFRIRCCIPCIVEKYDESNNTVECQPAIKERIIGPDGNIYHINLPILINVPVVFQSTSSLGIKFKLKQGDEVLVIFSDLSIDNFWLSGKVSEIIETRRHDLSDGIAIPCCLSIPKNNEIKTEIKNSNDLVLYNEDSIIKVDKNDIIFETTEGQITVNEIIQMKEGNKNEI